VEEEVFISSDPTKLLMRHDWETRVIESLDFRTNTRGMVGIFKEVASFLSIMLLRIYNALVYHPLKQI
jgi:hypothetical protein